MQNQNVIKVLGVGPSGEIYNKKFIEEADILVGGKRLLKFFDNINCEKIVLSKNIKQTIINLKKLKDKNIVILASGDPLFFGIGKTLLNIFNKNELKFYPYLNSVQLLCNKVKIPYENVENISIHGRDFDFPYLKNLIKKNQKVAILTDKNNNINKLAKYLKEFDDIDIFIGQLLGTAQEKILNVSVEEMKYIKPSDLDTVLIINNKPQLDILLGIEDNKIEHEKGLITKKEVRIISLSYLELKNNSILWDIGAGSGSVSIEASFLLPNGKIFAIEKNSKRVKQIKTNINKFQCFNVSIVCGEAPEVLKELIIPDRIFIGGNSGGILPILEYVKNIVKKGAIAVINLVSVEKIAEIVRFCKINELFFQSSLVHINNLSEIGESVYYKANNPVYIFKIIF